MMQSGEQRFDGKAAWPQLAAKIGRMIDRIGPKSPHVAGADGRYDDRRLDWWTSGFWPGLLWLAYDMTGEERFRLAAWHWDERLERLTLEVNAFDHDVGFQFLPTAVFKYKLTGDKDAARRALAAANFLAGRFNSQGRFIRAWNGDRTGWSIVDTCMNLALLFWASEESGDPRFAHTARAHADTALRHFIREDGSARHIVRFDPATGAYAETLGGQGAAPDSAWSRGAAWALYGLAAAHRWTGEAAYLRASQRVAHFFLAHLPADGVPPWDFRAGAEPAGEPRDSSAGAIAASGLLELADLLPAAEGRAYRAAAERLLHALHTRCGTQDDDAHEAILRHGTGHRPAGENVDVSLIYGDYFFAEAVAKLCGWPRRIF